MGHFRPMGVQVRSVPLADIPIQRQVTSQIALIDDGICKQDLRDATYIYGDWHDMHSVIVDSRRTSVDFS